MPNLSLMELNRELDQHDIDKRVKYFIKQLYENQVALEQAVDDATKIIVALAQNVEQFVQLHEATQGQVTKLLNRHGVEGVEVKSEPFDG